MIDNKIKDESTTMIHIDTSELTRGRSFLVASVSLESLGKKQQHRDARRPLRGGTEVVLEPARTKVSEGRYIDFCNKNRIVHAK
jgi:hypothetical protein